MPNRILREGIIDSRAFNSLTDDAQLFYYRLMSIVDDFGRFEADPELLRVKLFGRSLDRWPLTRVSQSLADVSGVLTDDGHPLVTVYCVSSKMFLQINKFQQRIRAEKSKCPSPDGQVTVTRLTDDGPPHASRARTHSNTNTHTNTTSNVFSSEEANENESEQEPMKRETQELLDEQWKSFRGTAEQREVLPGGETDWMWSYHAWKALDFTQKQQAVQDVGIRPIDTAEMKSLPQNYIKGRKWERPLPPSRQPAARPLSRREEALERIRNGQS